MDLAKQIKAYCYYFMLQTGQEHLQILLHTLALPYTIVKLGSLE